MKKWIVSCIILLLIAGGVWWKMSLAKTSASASQQEDQPTWVSVTRGALKTSVEATGRVVPLQEVEIKSKASGEVMNVPVDVSDEVKEGDLLVQLDPEDEQRNVKKAKVNLTISQSRLEKAKMELSMAEMKLKSERANAQAALESAQIKAEDVEARGKRVEQLLDKKMASQEELDSAKASQAEAKSSLLSAQMRIEDIKSQELELDSKRQDILIAEQNVETDRISLADAERRLKETTSTAPISGIIADRDVQIGQIIASGVSNVGGGTAMLTIVDLSRIFVLVSVDESDIGTISVGQKATITVDAYPNRNLSGKVVRVATRGASTSNVVTFEVKVEVTSEDKHLLKPEMTANVEIITLDKADVLQLAVDAIQRRGPKSFVQILSTSGTVELHPVELGASDGEVMEILSGLSEGDKVMEIKKQGGRWESTKSTKQNAPPPGPPGF